MGEVYAELRNQPAGGAAYPIFLLKRARILLQLLVGIPFTQQNNCGSNKRGFLSQNIMETTKKLTKISKPTLQNENYIHCCN